MVSLEYEREGKSTKRFFFRVNNFYTFEKYLLLINKLTI